jgi:hypothetical protein
MKSELLVLETAEEVINCLKIAAGEIEHTIEVLQSKISPSDLADYKRMTGKIIIAIYSGLADPVLEGFPELRLKTYGEQDDRS